MLRVDTLECLLEDRVSGAMGRGSMLKESFAIRGTFSDMVLVNSMFQRLISINVCVGPILRETGPLCENVLLLLHTAHGHWR